MATRQQIDQIIEQIKAKLETLSEFQIEDLVRENDLGSQLCFKDAEPTILRTIELFNRTKTVNLEDVPYNLLNNFNSQLDKAIQMFTQFRDFNANQNNPVNQRNNLVNQFENQFDEFYQHTLPILTVGLLSGNDLSVQQAKLDQLTSELEKKTKVMFISAERFMYHFIKSIKKNDMVNFKDFFRQSSVFIIDDIQFIRGKEGLQEEFFHTFNSLIDKGSQIIISADRDPLKLDRVQERIKSRLAGGLVVSIDTPDVELKTKIVKKKIEEIKLALKDNKVLLTDGPSNRTRSKSKSKFILLSLILNAVPLFLIPLF